MKLYGRTVGGELNPKLSLEKQADKVPMGFYLITRVFPPGQYGYASLCTPFFRLNVREKEWLEYKDTLKQHRDKAFYIEWDKENVEVHIDDVGLFNIDGYEADQWGLFHKFEAKSECYLSYEDTFKLLGKQSEVTETPF
jgi:hypothetical protein